MRDDSDKFCTGGQRGFAVLLVLAVTVVIVMLIYYMRMHGIVYRIGKGRSDIEVPWRQWDELGVRKRKGRPPGRPTEQQPQISMPLGLTADASEDGQSRGRLILFFLPDGTIQGQWGGQFPIRKDVDFQVMGGQFKGVVDPEEVYSDDVGEDPSRLFFITKGRFMILETNDETGRVRNVAGHIYVRGWLCLGNVVEGEVILTSDEKNFHLYTWEGRAEQGRLGLFGVGP